MSVYIVCMCVRTITCFYMYVYVCVVQHKPPWQVRLSLQRVRSSRHRGRSGCVDWSVTAVSCWHALRLRRKVSWYCSGREPRKGRLFCVTLHLEHLHLIVSLNPEDDFGQMKNHGLWGCFTVTLPVASNPQIVQLSSHLDKYSTLVRTLRLFYCYPTCCFQPSKSEA